MLTLQKWKMTLCSRTFAAICNLQRSSVTTIVGTDNGSSPEALPDSSPEGPHTLASWIPRWTAMLKRACVPDARHDVETVVLHVLKNTISQNDKIAEKYAQSVNFSEVQKFYQKPISRELLSEVNKLCKKRAQRMPLQYVIGEWDFRELTLKMKPPVFIPRPETEMLIDIIKNSEYLRARDEDISFVEVGCGTGAISLSLLRELPQASAVAIDANIDAVQLTNENSKRYHCENRLKTYHHCLGNTCPQFLSMLPAVDFIVSNPPYIFSKDMHKLEPEISRYEDHDALDGGNDGMDVIKKIIKLAKYVLKPSGMIWLETDSKHPEAIKDWLGSHPDVDFHSSFTDFNERPRFVQLCFKPGWK